MKIYFVNFKKSIRVALEKSVMVLSNLWMGSWLHQLEIGFIFPFLTLCTAFGMIIMTWQYLNPEAIEKLAESNPSEGQTRTSKLKSDVNDSEVDSGHFDSFENSSKTSRSGSESNWYNKSRYAGEANPVYETDTEC